MIEDKRPYLIGETAFHHEGDISFLRDLVKAGISLGLDAIKFHLLFDLSDYFIKTHNAYDALE